MRGMQYQGKLIHRGMKSDPTRPPTRRLVIAIAGLVITAGSFAASPSRSQESPAATSPTNAASAPEASLPVREFTVEELTARAIARTQLGLPGGMVVATWSELAQGDEKVPRYSVRFLGKEQKTFTDYPSFLKRFSHSAREPGIAQARVLLLSVHAAHGLGFQVVSPDINALQIPAEIDFDQFLTPLEFVSMGRVRADLGDKYALIILGQCQPRACLRFQDGEIPVGKELFKQIERLGAGPRQLSIVRNPRENVYMVGKKVILREPYTPPANPSGELAKVIAPDMIGTQVVHPNPLRSSMTDVWILAGKWTDEPVQNDTEEVRKPTPEMVALAEQRVREALETERKEALARGIRLPEPPPASVAPKKEKRGG